MNTKLKKFNESTWIAPLKGARFIDFDKAQVNDYWYNPRYMSWEKLYYTSDLSKIDFICTKRTT